MKKSLLFAVIAMGIINVESANAARSIFEWTHNVYCVNQDFLPKYEVLKQTTGYLHSGMFRNVDLWAMSANEKCQSLIEQCQSRFGADYVYVQSGGSYNPYWDTVKDVDGVICQHRYADRH